jgi:hypothetical protein
VSSKNSEDIDKIKQEHDGVIDDEFRVILVDDIVDVLKHAIVGFDEKYINQEYLMNIKYNGAGETNLI